MHRRCTQTNSLIQWEEDYLSACCKCCAIAALLRPPPFLLQDPEGFIEDGGWSFLDASQSDSEGDDADEESDFAPR